MRKFLENQIILNQEAAKEYLNFDYNDDYSVAIHDLTILYAPSLNQLDNFAFVDNVQDLESYAILRKTLVSADLQTHKQTEEEENGDQLHVHKTLV